MRFKKPRSLRNSNQIREPQSEFAEAYLADNILTCYRLRRDLPRKALVSILFSLQKAALVANVASFVKMEGPHWLALAGALEEKDAESFRQNLTSVAELEKCEVPATGAVGFCPWGYLFPESFSYEVSEMLAADEDVLEAYQERIARRMDKDPGGDYLFPDLSPESYAAAKEKMNRKPS